MTMNENDFIDLYASEETGQTIADKLNTAGLPGEVLFVKCDVTKVEDIRVGVKYCLCIFSLFQDRKNIPYVKRYET